MPAKKQIKKITPSKLIKTKGKFDWKKVTLIVVILAALGTILVRLSYAATPTTCYFDQTNLNCETTHGFGRLDARVWPGAWYGGPENIPNYYGKVFWQTRFMNQSGKTSAPSGIAYHYCVQLEANNDHPDANDFYISGESINNTTGVNKIGTLTGSFSVNGLRWLMKNKANGSSLQAESTNGVRGIVCGDIKGSAGTYYAPLAQATMFPKEGTLRNYNYSLLVNYIQMQRL